MNWLQGLEGLKEEVDLAAALGEEPLPHHLELYLDQGFVSGSVSGSALI
jgi:hypothetical protein